MTERTRESSCPTCGWSKQYVNDRTGMTWLCLGCGTVIHGTF